MSKMLLWVLASALLRFTTRICAAEGVDLFTRSDIPLLKIVVGTNAIQELWRSPRSYVAAATVTEGSETFLGVGVHLKGGAGSGQPLSRKPSLSLHFGKYQKSQRFHGLKHLQLNNCAQDPTYLNEILSSEVFLSVGIPCPRCTHVLVSLNGKDLGLYVLREGVGQDFLGRSFGSARGNALQGTYGIDVDGKLENTVTRSGPSLNSDDLHCILSMSDPESRFQALRDFVDWEAFVLFMAAEVITTHGDGYTLGLNNYRLFVPQIRDPAGVWKAGPLHMIPSGMDQMLMGSGFPALPFVVSKLGRSVLASSTGRALYREAFGRVFTNGFCAANLEDRIVSLSQRISKALETTEPSKLPEILERIEALRQRVAERTSLLQAYLEHPIVPLFNQFTTETARPTAVSSPPPGSVVVRVPSMAWTDSHRIGEGILMRTNLAGNGECLVVRSQALHNNSGGSWRARVRLPAGDYLFEGEVTRLYSSQIAESVAPVILFQLMDGRRTPLPWPRKDGEVARLHIHFKVTAPEEVVELCCGLDGMRSGVVFPIDSIKLTRL